MFVYVFINQSLSWALETPSEETPTGFCFFRARTASAAISAGGATYRQPPPQKACRKNPEAARSGKRSPRPSPGTIRQTIHPESRTRLRTARNLFRRGFSRTGSFSNRERRTPPLGRSRLATAGRKAGDRIKRVAPDAAKRYSRQPDQQTVAAEQCSLQNRNRPIGKFLFHTDSGIQNIPAACRREVSRGKDRKTRRSRQNTKQPRASRVKPPPRPARQPQRHIPATALTDPRPRLLFTGMTSCRAAA